MKNERDTITINRPTLAVLISLIVLFIAVGGIIFQVGQASARSDQNTVDIAKNAQAIETLQNNINALLVATSTTQETVKLLSESVKDLQSSIKTLDRVAARLEKE
mgnify:CR=1 FL=1